MCVPNSSSALLRSASLTFWKSRNRTVGHRQITQYRYFSRFVTGLSSSTRCVRRPRRARGSRSDSSASWLEARARQVRLGTAFARSGWMAAMRLRANSSVRRRGVSGKLPSTWMSLSVKSMASWGYTALTKEMIRARGGGGGLTPAAPRFSMATILFPVGPKKI